MENSDTKTQPWHSGRIVLIQFRGLSANLTLGQDRDPTEILAAIWCVSWHLRRELLPGRGLRHIRGKHDHSEHRNDLASLAGAVRFLTSSETSDGHGLDEGVVKRVTGQSRGCRPGCELPIPNDASMRWTVLAIKGYEALCRCASRQILNSAA